MMLYKQVQKNTPISSQKKRHSKRTVTVLKPVMWRRRWYLQHRLVNRIYFRSIYLVWKCCARFFLTPQSIFSLNSETIMMMALTICESSQINALWESTLIFTDCMHVSVETCMQSVGFWASPLARAENWAASFLETFISSMATKLLPDSVREKVWKLETRVFLHCGLSCQTYVRNPKTTPDIFVTEQDKRPPMKTCA